MKRNIAILALTLLTLFASINTYARNDKDYWKDKIANMTEAQKEARVTEIKARVQEIKDMDKSKLSSEDRKALRHELRDMNKEARAIGNGGIYISLAGILIIILVLILIL
ncbi:hypothetical protein FC093_10265 [Ilyomonas limi]|uniref:Seryl-tRNA synthetase n=1 Tax=Ilyomonas limi TaxID=2575867 RepID=A0A4U3L2M3_9BACT|nr:hypothetical protein [Ilyomonas limi]TKK68499.1 hypothetical protein FC093_10265 [Ilyomonas limi]